MISFIVIHLFRYKKKDYARTPRHAFRETRDHARKTNPISILPPEKRGTF